MSFITLMLMAIGLSMDACAVAICKGLSMRQASFRKAAIVGLYFGGFQAAMPLVGFLLGIQFASLITSVDHWIAFVLLLIIGGKMVKEGFEDDDCCCDTEEPDLSPKAMLPLAVATSIDALAVGISYAFLQVKIAPAVTLIGVTTFAISAAGVKVGNVFGGKYKSKAELAGGVILVLMGVKILLEHTVLA